MTLPEAKEILLLHRDGIADAGDRSMAEALELMRQEPELRRWFEEQRLFQSAMRAKFGQIEVPAGLKERLLEAAPSPSNTARRWDGWFRWAAAAAMVALIASTTIWLKPRAPDRFADYRARMVRTVLREYRMDIPTNDMASVRRYLATRGAPADYVVPPGLMPLQLTGGGFLRWRNQPVAMVCFNRGDNQMLFLFVMNSPVKDSPPATPAFSKVSDLATVSWTGNGKTYILAGPEEPDFLRTYFGSTPGATPAIQ